MKNESNIKVRIPKALYELYKKEHNGIDSKGVLKEMLKNQLKRMLTEAEEEVEISSDLANTTDEKTLEKRIKDNSAVSQALGNIGTGSEIDGALRAVIPNFKLQKMPKSNIIDALKRALHSMSPEDNTVSTGLNEGVKKVIRIKKK